MEEPKLLVDKAGLVIPELDEEYPELCEKEKIDDKPDEDPVELWVVLVDSDEDELLIAEAEENVPEEGGVILDEGEDIKVLIVEELALEVVALVGCDVLELEEGPDVVLGGVIELEEDDTVELKVGIGNDE